MFCGGTMAEGWACYATQLMAEHGFLTPLEEFGEAHADLRMAARPWWTCACIASRSRSTRRPASTPNVRP